MTTAQTPKATKRVPLRTCVVCRRKAPKRELLRHVCLAGDGAVRVMADQEQRLPGRGFYACAEEACRERLPLVCRKRFRA